MTLQSLTTTDRQLVVDTTTGVPELLWFGLPLSGDLDALGVLGERSIPNASLDAEGPATLLPAESVGWLGQPGVEGRRVDGSAWSPRWSPVSAETTESRIITVGHDERAELTVETTITLEPSGVSTFRVLLRNDGSSEYVLDRMAITLPMPAEVTELQVPEGRWVHEYHEVRIPWRVGAVEVANRRGRTSHDKPPWIFAGERSFSNQSGHVVGVHLGWSGNAAIRAEVFTDGRRVLQLGELFLGDEVRIGPGESYESPIVHLAWSDKGMNGVSQAFHEFLRARPQHPSPSIPRPIHMNTWEAVYFNHDLDTLKALADRAAEVGAERYVLDDGWFHGRRNDQAGLGDWWVDEEVWPNGLEPLIEHVRGLGMEMGIWVEPEMVNPDSDLYRSNPEWALGVPEYDKVTGRNHRCARSDPGGVSADRRPARETSGRRHRKLFVRRSSGRLRDLATNRPGMDE